jgi:hypothetical protein
MAHPQQLVGKTKQETIETAAGSGRSHATWDGSAWVGDGGKIAAMRLYRDNSEHTVGLDAWDEDSDERTDP